MTWKLPAIWRRSSRDASDYEICQVCGDCSFCLRAKAAKDLLRHLEIMVREVEMEIYAATPGEGEMANPMFTAKKRKVTAARKFIASIREAKP